MKRQFGRIPREGWAIHPSVILGFLLFWGPQNGHSALIPPREMTTPVKVRVRLTAGVAQAVVRGFDLRLFEGRKLASRLDRLTQWEITCSKGRIRAVSYETGKRLDLHSEMAIESPAGFFNYQNKPYRDTLRIYPTSASLCEVVNEVEVEKYLDGLVNAEFSARWNEEAIAAQVIAARSYALYQIRKARKKQNSHFDLDATIKDQVYDGSMLEDYRSSRAVARTRGMVLAPKETTRGTTRSHLPLKAFYHSTCGGKTLLPEQVWGGGYPGFRRQVACPYCVSSPSFRWSAELAGSEFATAFLQGALDEGATPSHWPFRWREALEGGKLVDLRVSKLDSSGRVLEVSSVWLIGKESLQLTLSSARFRTWIGSTRVRSSFFQITPQPHFFSREWQVSGGGYGHGVGLCQWGAKVMGEKGFTVSAILKHYYPDAAIRKLW